MDAVLECTRNALGNGATQNVADSSVNLCVYSVFNVLNGVQAVITVVMTVAVALILTLAVGVTVSIEVLCVDTMAVTIAWLAGVVTCVEVAVLASICNPRVVSAYLFLFTLEGVGSQGSANMEGIIAVGVLLDFSVGLLMTCCDAVAFSGHLNSWYNHLTRGDCSHYGIS